jgi:hypothetical protein
MTPDDKNRKNGLISNDEFRELACVHDSNCVSIYIPTERAGHKADQKHARIRLKNCLKEIRSKLEMIGLTRDEINNYLEPVESL